MKSKEMQVAELKNELSSILTKLIEKGIEYTQQQKAIESILNELFQLTYKKGCIETELMMLNNIQEDES